MRMTLGRAMHTGRRLSHQAQTALTLPILDVPGQPTGLRSLLRYLLFFAPSHLAAGVALGGLIATIGATGWYVQCYMWVVPWVWFGGLWL